MPFNGKLHPTTIMNNVYIFFLPRAYLCIFKKIKIWYDNFKDWKKYVFLHMKTWTLRFSEVYNSNYLL